MSAIHLLPVSGSDALWTWLLAVVCGAVSLHATLAVWIPSIRLRWRGPTRRAGKMSCAGFGLVFAGFAIGFGLTHAAVADAKPYLTPLVVVGFILIVLGKSTDFQGR